MPETATHRLRRLVALVREPIPEEKETLLAERWDEIPESIRRPGQGFGRQATGCGATVGAMPRCDFDCEGCYLGVDANTVPPLPLDAVLRQIDELRRYLGPKGNLQVTDGEVTLLPRDHLVAILRHARDVGLIPMVMTHGDSFRREPDLLSHLVAEGGLTEVSIHVDSLQRGRRGEYRDAQSEAELMPLRDELAEVVREARRQTGVRLRAATTLTVSRDNIEEIPAVVAWALANRDAFGLISFQPLAQVGRTRDYMEGVRPEELWNQVGQALRPHGFDAARRTPLQLGHPDCTRMEPMAVYQRNGSAPQLVPIIRPGEDDDVALVEEFFAKGLGGLNFRDDSLPERISRGAGLLFRAPAWFLGRARRWCTRRAAELDTGLLRVAWECLRGRARLDSFMVVSHHFMDPTEVESERGRERLSACVFRVPVDGEMVPMCRMNAGGGRDVVYAASKTLPPEASPLRVVTA